MYRASWVIRAILYKFFFRSLAFPSYLGKPVFLKGTKNIVIKRRVRIFPGLRMEVHNSGDILIEENVGIGQNVHITCSNINLTISKGVTILANSFITNIDHSYQNIDMPILEQPIMVSRTFIGENCFIGIGVAIQAGTVLGKQCIVGANAVVRGTYPDYCVIAGAPAKIIKRYNFQTKIWEKTNHDGSFIV
jgi:acetyltransferase-like isoleucine patch superfamily enzyme